MTEEKKPAPELLRDYSVPLATYMSQFIAQSMIPEPDKTKLKANSEKTREIYEKILEEQESHPDHPTYWKEQFIKTAQSMLKTYTPSDNESDEIQPSKKLKIEEKEIKIGYVNSREKTTKMFTFDSKIDLIIIGRYEIKSVGCDIKMRTVNDNYVSRVHLIVIPLKNTNKFALVDVGSLSGIRIIKKNKNNCDETSLPNARKVLFIDFDDFAVIKAGQDKIIFNPKECIVCMENPRGIEFSCKHNVVCPTCAKGLKTCPICRENIGTKLADKYEMVSFAIQKP